jgi:hypothetical protein
MPKWVEDRKDYLMKKNPEMAESTAWALATQQGRAAGKVEKAYGTSKGKKKAKKKYKKPQSAYEKKAKPKKKKADVCDNLLALANQLDEQGFEKLADHVTDLLKIALKK